MENWYPFLFSQFLFLFSASDGPSEAGQVHRTLWQSMSWFLELWLTGNLGVRGLLHLLCECGSWLISFIPSLMCFLYRDLSLQHIIFQVLWVELCPSKKKKSDILLILLLCLVARSCLTLCDPMDCNPSGSSINGDSLGKNTGVNCYALLQEFFPSQGSNLGLLHCGHILHWLSHQGSPRILQWVAYSFSSGSSQPRNQTGVSCIAGRFYTIWATRD